jgi:signal transduction histidine kinase
VLPIPSARHSDGPPARASRDRRPDLSLRAASRLAVTTFVGACVGVVAALWIADRALARTELPDAGALRLASWLLGATALAAAAAGVRQERRVARRAAERSAELERLSAELFQANRAKSEFLANVSHELRTPLNAVVGFAELLQEGVYGELSPRQGGPVQRIAASAGHLRHLVDQILDLAKIAAGRLEVHTELMTLRPFVLDVAGEMESLVHEKGLALSVGVPAGLPKLRSDPLHVRQVLVNLLGNAVKFTPSGGRVSVRGSLVEAPAGAPPFASSATAAATAATPRATARRAWRPTASAWPRSPARPTRRAAYAPSRRRCNACAGASARSTPGPPVSWVALQVVDTGPGVAPEHQARIFDEFEQLGPRTGDAAVRGTGLGLAISRRLALLLGANSRWRASRARARRSRSGCRWIRSTCARRGRAARAATIAAPPTAGAGTAASTARRTRGRWAPDGQPFLNSPRRRPNRPSERSASPAASPLGAGAAGGGPAVRSAALSAAAKARTLG